MGRIKKWPLPRIIVIDSSHIADFPSHPFSYPVITNLHLPASPSQRLRGKPIGNRYIADMYHLPSMIGLSIAPPPPGRGTPSRPDQPWPQAGHLKLLIVLKIVHSAQVLGKRAEKPFFRGMAG
ncbi:hypothetical protein [Aeromonas rivipollensis]|uniref:hypothetical protein n=1 Tax=Aeromonas rivipollensis TaxID=948519 RepID=UPI003D1EF856